MLIFLVSLFFYSSVSSEDCSFNFNRTDAPFIVDDNFEFPQNGSFKIDELFYVGCLPGTTSLDLDENGDHVICKGGTTVVNVRTLNFLDVDKIRCKPPPHLVTKVLLEKCEGNRFLVQVGHQMMDTFIPSVTICFDSSKLIPFYAKYQIKKVDDFNVDSIPCVEQNATVIFSVDKCVFSDSPLYYNISLDSIYLNQKTILEDLKLGLLNTLITWFPLAIVMGYSGEAQLQYAKTFAIFDYSGAVLIWDRHLDGWMLTSLIIVEEYSFDLLYSGTLGVLTLNNTDGSPTEVYLGDGQLPVPKWVWSVGASMDTLFALYNSPLDLDNDNEVTELCKSFKVIYDNIISCYTIDVVHPELREFLDNNLA